MINILDISEDRKCSIMQFIQQCKYNEEQILEIKKSIKHNIHFYELGSTKTLSPKDNKKIIFILFDISPNKNIKEVINLILKPFDKNKIFLFLIAKYNKNQCYVSFNLNMINNEIVNTIYKKIFISKEIDSIYLNDLLMAADQIPSINWLFENMCKKTLYFIKNNKILEKNIDWDYFKIINEIKKLEKEKSYLESKHKKLYNAQERIVISNNIQKINNDIKELRKLVQNFE